MKRLEYLLDSYVVKMYIPIKEKQVHTIGTSSSNKKHNFTSSSLFSLS